MALLLAARVAAGRQASESGCAELLLMRSTEGLFVEFLRLDGGQVQVFPAGAKPELVAPVLPVGPGVAGDLVTAANPRTVVVRWVGGEAHFAVRTPNAAQPRGRPSVPAATYERYRLRVNNHGDSLARRAWAPGGRGPGRHHHSASRSSGPWGRSRSTLSGV